MLWLQTSKEGSGIMNLGGSLTRQGEQDCNVNDSSPHIVNIGRMVEVSLFLFNDNNFISVFRLSEEQFEGNIIV